MSLNYFSDAVKFLENVKETDSVIIIFNNDADGICSCVLTKTYLKTKGISNPYIISQPMPTERGLIRKIQTSLPTKLIFLDLAIDQQYNVIKKLGGICDILVMDHHSIHRDLNNENVTHHNPRFEDAEIYQSTTHMAHKVCSELMDMDKYLWITAIGMIGDYNLEYSQDLVKKVKEKYTLEGDLYDTFLGRMTDMISSVRATNDLTCEQIVELYETIDDVKDFEKNEASQKMIKSLETIKAEEKAIEEDFEKNVEVFGNVMFYELKSKFNIVSALSTKLSKDHMDKMLVIFQKSYEKVHASARNQGKKFDVASIMKNAAVGLKASAGGHPAAAGATVASQDWDTFKDRIISKMR